MPLKRCKKEGKSGWQWGDSGVCYTGKDGKKKAIKQGIAIEGPDKFKKEMKKAKGSEEDWPSQQEVDEAVREYGEENGSDIDNFIADVDANLKAAREAKQ